MTAVWSRSEARVKEAAQKFNIPRAVTSYDDMLAMDDLDVISVVSPVAMHYEMTMAALGRRQARYLRKALHPQPKHG